MLWLDKRLGWPAGDAMVVGFLVNLPVQLMINAYLWTGGEGGSFGVDRWTARTWA